VVAKGQATVSYHKTMKIKLFFLEFSMKIKLAKLIITCGITDAYPD
jgi:hypothetical protein